MAIDNQFGKGIGLAAGFDLGAQKPLDSRIAVNTIAERDAHVDNNRAYEGMIVFVDETKRNYQLINGEWVELLLEEKNRLDALEAMLNGGGSGEEGEEPAAGALATLQANINAVDARLNQGGDIENRIAQNESDIDGLQGLVGVPADGENEASGLHLALDNAKEELDQAILDEKDRAEEQEQAIRNEMAAAIGQHAVEADPENNVEAVAGSGLRKEIDDAVKAEKDRAEGQESAIRQELADEAAEIRGEIAEDKQAQAGIDEEQDNRIKALEDANKENGAVANAIKAVQDNLDAFEEAQGQKNNALDAEDLRIVGLVEAEAAEARKQEGLLQDAIDQEIEDRKAADKDLADRLDIIEGENEGSIKKAVADLKAIHDEEMQDAEDRIAALEALHDGENSVENQIANAKQEALDAVEDEKDRAEGEEAKIRQELANEKTALQAEIDADVKVVADELAKQMDAEQDGTLAKQIADEVARADAEEKRIVGLVETEKGRAEGKEQELLNAINKEIEDREQAIEDAVEAINGAADALEARVKANEDDIVEMKAEEAKIREDFAAADAQVLADAKAHAEQKIADLVDSAPDAMNTLNELAEAINNNKGIYDAYVDQHNKDMAALKEELQGEIDSDIAAESALRVAEEQRIEGLVNTEKDRAEGQEAAIRQEMAAAIGNYANEEEQVEASGLRKEIAEADAAIRADMEEAISKVHQHNNKEVLDGINADKVAAWDAAQANAEAKAAELDAALKLELQQEIDDDVQALADRHDEEMDAAEGRIADLEELVGKPVEGENPATGLCKSVNEVTAVANQASEDVEDLKERVNTAEGQLDNIAEALAENTGAHDLMKGRLDKLEAANAEGGDVAKAIIAAQDAADAAQGEVDALETVVGNNKTACEEAMAQEVIDRNQAIATAESGMKTMLANVVNSLGIALVEDKLQLTLGIDSDPIVIKEVELDMVTDADIDEIIAGLDAVEDDNQNEEE